MSASAFSHNITVFGECRSDGGGGEDIGWHDWRHRGWPPLPPSRYHSGRNSRQNLQQEETKGKSYEIW